MNNDVKTAARLAEVTEKLKTEIGTVIIGQNEVIEQLLIALFANRHCFMVGVPGLAKTLMISSLAHILQLSFKRIQFTPDLMPSDITGAEIIQGNPDTGVRHFEFVHGPIFANIVLADEINRTPPKTQAALLEAMQERQVTIGNRSFELNPPFFVLATQNPIEQEGTYPLPEAQLDRFMLSILVDYPGLNDELEILKRTTAEKVDNPTPILHASDVIELQQIVRRVPVGDHVFEFVLDLVRRTRPTDHAAPDFIREWVDIGAGPRAGQNLIIGAKVRALMHGRFFVNCDDIRHLAKPVLRHRLITNFNADSENIQVDDIIGKLLDETPAPEQGNMGRHKS